MNYFLDLLVLGAIISAVLTITAVNPVNAVIGLISVYVHIAIYLIILTFNFIGLSYLIIYVGAIAILFLFVVMMMNIKYIELSEVAQEYTQNLPLGAIIGTLFLFELLSSALMPYDLIDQGQGETARLFWTNLQESSELNIQNMPLLLQEGPITSYPLDLSESILISSSGQLSWDISIIFYSFSHIEGLGYTLYTYGLLWFILGSMILLLAMIGPIALCYSPTKKNSQNDNGLNGT
jgi:NADH-ubiquinone oxidoreductase chain 6